MKFVHPYYFHPLEIDPDFPVTLVMENPKMFRKVIFELIDQCNGYDGDFALSENNEILDLSKTCVVVSDICRQDFMNRDIRSKVQKILESEITGEDETIALLSSIEQFGIRVADNFKYPLKYKIALQPGDLIKLLGFEINEEDALPFERLIDYLEIYENLLNRKLIVTVNLKEYFTEDEYDRFQKDITNRQINILMLERHTHSFDDTKHRIIIDQDLCEI